MFLVSYLENTRTLPSDSQQGLAQLQKMQELGIEPPPMPPPFSAELCCAARPPFDPRSWCDYAIWGLGEYKLDPTGLSPPKRIGELAFETLQERTTRQNGRPDTH